MKPQDLLVALYLATRPDDAGRPSYAELADALGLSQGEAHNARRRAAAATILGGESGMHVDRAALYEVVVHGLRYFFPPVRGAIAQGVPTAHSAPSLAPLFEGALGSVVWPSAEALATGESLVPLYRTVPTVALRDERLYEMLSIVEVLRIGRPREREIARKLVRDLLRASTRGS